jgi:transcriptional regulator with XRE-family HTH domain
LFDDFRRVNLHALHHFTWYRALQLEQAFGHALREFRRSKKITQENLALEAGLARNFVSLLERGERLPSLQTVFRLCEVMGVKPDALVADVARRQSDHPGKAAK